MTFELAMLIIVALAAVALGLICYHLLGRLEMLERSVQGGLTPPSSRLSREQFERRFRTAHARSNLAAEVTVGIVLIVGPEHDDDNELARTIAHLARPDLVQIRPADAVSVEDLGITTTPYLFVVDESTVRIAQPVAGASDLADALKRFT